MKEIQKIVKPAAPKENKRVAAYARVSVATGRTLHSLSTQVSYFSSLIQSTPGWTYAGVYSDEGISGTGTRKRAGFQQMMADAEAGKIDIILTKSIQRFARNTVDLLKAVRHLKELSVEVRFEKEHIHSLSSDGELMLTILASFAQEESRSISNNVKWATQKRFQQGIPNGKFHIFGYRWEGEKLVPYPPEAELVKKMYTAYLDQVSAETMAEKLKTMGVTSCYGRPLSSSTVREILRNVTYTGNLLFQKEYTVDPISGKSKINRGELPQYWLENTHEAIIPMKLYKQVQEEREHRRKLGVHANWSIHTTCFTGKVKCGICGKSYRRGTRGGKERRRNQGEPYHVWICQTKDRMGAHACSGKIIPENMLMKACAEVLGTDGFDESVFEEKVEKIVVRGEDRLEFHFKDGSVHLKEWHSTAHADYWTEEHRKACGERRREHPLCQYHEFTGFIRCGVCEANYRTETHALSDGTKTRHWHCPNACGNLTIRDETMKRLVSEVLGLTDFSAEFMYQELQRAVINHGHVTFYFRDGHTVEKSYQDKRRVVTHRRRIRENGQGSNYSSNAQSLYRGSYSYHSQKESGGVRPGVNG